jgi:predicted ATP-grasp superfamily ATP-dependent carboligase
MKPAIVLGMKINGLGILRNLGKQGIEVYGIDKENGIAFCSKYCRKKYVFPDPVAYPEECLTQFIKLGKNLVDKAILLPTNDPYVAFISKYRAELSDYFLFNIPKSSIIESILDKWQQYQLATNLGIPVPKTISPSNIDELKEGLISYPAVIKGRDTTKWYHAFNNKGLNASCYNELLEYFKQALDRNIEVIIQEMIIGSNKNYYGISGYYSKEKELLAIWATQRARQFPIDIGDGTYIITVHNPKLIALGRKILEGTGYTGAVNIQYKYDERDGQYKQIELNPRFGMATTLMAYAGVNVPYINYLDCTGEKVTPSLDYKENISWCNINRDVRSFWDNRKRGDISFIEWIKSIFSINCHPYYARDDFKPLCKFYASAMWGKFKKICKFKI